MKGTTYRMTTNRYCRGIAVGIAALILASAAHASSITIFNTGVDVNRAPLPDGKTGDPHYVLTSVPGGTTELRVRTAAGGYPVPPWLVDNLLSAWIGPNNPNDNPASPTTEVDGPPGRYIYRTTFNLGILAPDTAFLSGRWAMDNEGIDILLNGVSTGNSALDTGGQAAPNGGPFQNFTSFSIRSGFVAGPNTLEFIVNNIDSHSISNPTGLRVEISGTANTPEPASLALFGAGFAGLFLLRRRLGWAGKLQ